MQFKDRDSEENDGERLFDADLIRGYIQLGLGAVRRRKLLMIGVWVAIVGATFGGLLVMPSTYHVETTLFAQRNQVLVVRGDGPDAVAPTRGAVEIVQRTEALVAVIQATDLIAHYREHRAPLEKLLDAVQKPFSTLEATPDDELDAMVELLGKRLTVWTNDNTVTIALDWTDAQMACRLVNAIQQNFLETRYAQEVTALAESSAIVGSHAAGLRDKVDEAVATIEKLRAGPPGASQATPPAPRGLLPAQGPPAGIPAPTEASLASATMVAKQRAYDNLEESRRRRLAEVQSRLLDLRFMYTDSYPSVVESQQAVAALSAESPQAKALARDIAALAAVVEAEGREADAAGRVVPTRYARPFVRALPPADGTRVDEILSDDRDPTTAYPRGQLRDAMEKYSALLAQVQSAEIDLQTAEAAFKYRYGILTPARLPKRPSSPSRTRVMAAAVAVASLLALLGAVAVDLRTRRLRERWQIERLLDRPVLGELVLGAAPRRAAQ